MPDKITNRFHIRLIIFFLFCLATYKPLNAQHDLKIISSWSEYKQEVRQDSLNRMVELKSTIPGIQYDLRYATENNFMHQKLYRSGTTTFLRLPVAKALAKVQEELSRQGLSLKIWDAYRPYEVTVKMWEPIKDDRYVADPKKGSGHNRGIAVDLTIVEKENGHELNMGTGFDNFSDTAHPGFTNLPQEILSNRTLLKTVMEKYGFKALDTEWWHFFWSDSDHFELMDIDFRKFKKRLN